MASTIDHGVVRVRRPLSDELTARPFISDRVGSNLHNKGRLLLDPTSVIHDADMKCRKHWFRDVNFANNHHPVIVGVHTASKFEFQHFFNGLHLIKNVSQANIGGYL
jgi:hypothetical protein